MPLCTDMTRYHIFISIMDSVLFYFKLFFTMLDVSIKTTCKFVLFKFLIIIVLLVIYYYYPTAFELNTWSISYYIIMLDKSEKRNISSNLVCIICIQGK